VPCSNRKGNAGHDEKKPGRIVLSGAFTQMHNGEQRAFQNRYPTPYSAYCASELMRILACGQTDLFMTPLSTEQLFAPIVRSLRNSCAMIGVALRRLRQTLAPAVKTSVTVGFGGTCIQSQRFRQDKHRNTTDWRMRNETARQSRWASFKVRGGGGGRRGNESITDYTRATERDAVRFPTMAEGCGSGRAVGAGNRIKRGRLWRG